MEARAKDRFLIFDIVISFFHFLYSVLNIDNILWIIIALINYQEDSNLLRKSLNKQFKLCLMSDTHRLHPKHTGRTESDAVAVFPRTTVCNSCLEPLSQNEKTSFHCNQCDYKVCTRCDEPQTHPVHPNHQLYLVTPTSQWRCYVCKRPNTEIKETVCYNCEICDFLLCKNCSSDINSQLHQHTLLRTDVRLVYGQSSGDWRCDICGNNNGPGDFYPAHCQQCQFDLCENCLKPYRSTYHGEEHLLYKADSTITYPLYHGGWRCDRCLRSFAPHENNIPFHCSQCEFDLCPSCMNTTGMPSNKVETRSPPLGTRSPAPVTASGKPISSPSEEVDNNVGATGPPGAQDDVGNCVICLERPKDATIVHGTTGHVCCCTYCASELFRRGENCPICRAPIQTVIKQYTV
ncbi:E3 ubiquitin-protein ligase Mdm2-like isoform X2 [Dendronephthya gigantea]|uniref:E3 ubiquitin-protein ligase Mdm2-like isoform X2 n=1 Tax=Dendronephthya gigantea TaxID=151771 RepID=UPI00106C586E|nr:E3 ubiquitin-protein ligase Mdm2-like isoform X2 [Dendronephthya gigantea]